MSARIRQEVPCAHGAIARAARVGGWAGSLRGAIFSWALFAAAGCTSPWTIERLHSDLEAVRRQVVSPPSSPGLVLLRAAVHVHSEYSHDCDGSIAEIAKAARSCNVQVVFLTDHTNPAIFARCPEGWFDGVYFVRGEEISKRGSVLALGTTSSIRSHGKDMQTVITEVVDGGGVAAIGHLEKTDTRGVTGYSTVSIHNLHADAKRIPLFLYPKVLLDALLYSNGRANEILLHDLVQRSGPELRKWDALLAKGRVSAIAEVDAHQNLGALGVDLDPYHRILRVLHTYLIVPENWTRADLLDAVRTGRSYIGFSLIADPSGFSFHGLHADGHAVPIGNDVALREGLQLCIASPAPGLLIVMKDGKEYARTHGRELTLACNSPGVYRAEVRVELGGEIYPWIFSNPIYVDDVPATLASSAGGTGASAVSGPSDAPSANAPR